MARRNKQLQRLDTLEKAFLSELTDAAITASTRSHSRFFLARRYNLWPEPRGRTDAATDRLVDTAHEILDLRAELGEPSACPAFTFIDYCQRFVDTSDNHRPGVTKHAAALLEALRATSA